VCPRDYAAVSCLCVRENNCFFSNYEREMWLLVWLFHSCHLFILFGTYLAENGIYYHLDVWFMLMKQSCSSGIEHGSCKNILSV